MWIRFILCKKVKSSVKVAEEPPISGIFVQYNRVFRFRIVIPIKSQSKCTAYFLVEYSNIVYQQ